MLYKLSIIFDVFTQASCGFEYTSKLQRMFQDVSINNTLNENFKSHLQKQNINLQR